MNRDEDYYEGKDAFEPGEPAPAPAKKPEPAQHGPYKS